MRVISAEKRSNRMLLFTFNIQKIKDVFQAHSMKKSIFLKRLKTKNQLMNLIGNLFLKRLMNLVLRIATISMLEILSQENT